MFYLGNIGTDLVSGICWYSWALGTHGTSTDKSFILLRNMFTYNNRLSYFQAINASQYIDSVRAEYR